MTKTTTALTLVLCAAVAAVGVAGDEPAKDAKDKAASSDPRTKAEILSDAEKQFARADVTGDGNLAGEEIVKGWVERYDLNGDGKITKTEFIDVSTRPPKLRHPTPMRDVVARVRYDVAIFDKNKDGIIQKEEYPGDQNKFRKYDKNKDAALSADEVKEMAEDEIADIKKKMEKPDRYEMLVLFDSDKDNNVALDEYDGPMDAFKKYDKNADGVVTYDELYPEKMAERMKAEMENGPKPEDLSILETMDKNKDGKVVRDEFKGTDDAFKRLDKNGDGVITTADAR